MIFRSPLRKTYPKTKLQDRLNEAAKRRSTLATLTKAVNAEATAIIAELGQESARLIARKKLLPAEYEHLFKDWLELISGDADLEPIVAERVQAEKQRQAQVSAAQVDPDKTTQQAVEKTARNCKGNRRKHSVGGLCYHNQINPNNTATSG